MKPIILRVHKAPALSESRVGVVRISPEAEDVLRSFVRETGLPIRAVASQIIIQAADLVEVKEED